MVRKVALVVAAFLVVAVIGARESQAQTARYQLRGVQRTQAGAELKLVVHPEQYNRVHVVVATTNTTWNQLKQHPAQGTILHDFGTHVMTPRQVHEMKFDLPYGGQLRSGAQGILATRFYNDGQSYIHVWGANATDTHLTLP